MLTKCYFKDSYLVNGDSTSMSKCGAAIDKYIPKKDCVYGENLCGLGGIYQPSSENRRIYVSFELIFKI